MEKDLQIDDWHGHEPDYDQHERLACKEWLDKNNFKYELLRNGLHGEMVSNTKVSIAVQCLNTMIWC